MKTLTYEEPKTIAVSDHPNPTPHDLDSAVVQMTAAKICSSDLHIYNNHSFSRDLKFCVGHEAISEVVKLSNNVRGFNVGNQILVPASTNCNVCEPYQQN